MRDLIIFSGLALGFGLLIIAPDLNLADRAWCIGMMASTLAMGYGIGSVRRS